MARATSPKGQQVLGRLECGCKVTTDGEDIHSWPCSREHDEMMIKVCAEIAAENAIPFEIEENL